MCSFQALVIAAAALLLTACADQGSDARLINVGAGGPSASGAQDQSSGQTALQAPVVGRAATPGAYAKKRLAVQMVGACAKDPDPTGFFGDDIYDDCAAKTLEAVKAKVAATLAATGAFASVGDGDRDLVLTVTLTKLMVDTGMGGFIGDMTATTKMSATYQLADAAGHGLASGTVNIESGSDDPNQTWLRFANQLAANLLGAASGGAPVTQAGAPVAPPKFGVGVIDLAPSVASELGTPRSDRRSGRQLPPRFSGRQSRNSQRRCDLPIRRKDVGRRKEADRRRRRRT